LPEGSAIVMSLIQTGKIEAIVGVSCLSVLERAFPYMEAAAIPALPSLCCRTIASIPPSISMDLGFTFISPSDDQTRRLDLSALRDEVEFWFTPASLDLIMGSTEGQPRLLAGNGSCARASAGVRFSRSRLSSLAVMKLAEPFPEDLEKIAVAVGVLSQGIADPCDIEDQ